MANVPDESAAVLSELARRIGEVEQRVLALEKTPSALPEASAPSRQESEVPEPSPANSPTGIISILGRAVLGIALAYLFRAAFESAILPGPLLVSAAILYAALWLMMSKRLRPSDAFARAVYALTAALIFSPLVWETTARFHILTTTTAAGALAAFMIFGLGLSFRFDLRAAPIILALFVAPTAVLLVIDTGAVVPFVISILAVGLTVELGACFSNWPNLRPIVAAAADFVVWLMSYLLARPEGPPSGYLPADKLRLVSLPVALFVVYGASTAYRTLVRGLPITVFEFVQFPVSVALAVTGVAAATFDTTLPTLGAVTVALAAACYVTAFTRFRQDAQRRNFYVFSTYAAAFAVVGIWMLFSAAAQTAFFCLAAIITMLFGTAKKNPTLRYHATVYLLGAFLSGGFFPLLARAFVGANPGAITPIIWFAILTALVCYLTAWKLDGRLRQDHLVAFLAISLAASALASAAVILLVGLVARSRAPDAGALAVIRTALICASAFVFGALYARFKRIELVWAAYGALACGTVKIMVEDLRLERKEWLAVSLFLYGLLLVFLPRVLRGVSKRT